MIFILCVAVSLNKPIVNISGGLIILFYLLSGHWQLKAQAFKNLIVLGCLALFGILLLGCFYTPYEGAFQALLGRNWLLYPLFFFPFLCGQVKRVQWCLIGVLVSFFTVMLFTYVNFLFLSPSWYFSLNGSSYPNVNPYTLMAIIYMYLIFCGYFYAFNTQNKTYRYIFFSIAVLALIAEYAINTSRLGYITEFIIMSVFIYARWKWRGLLSLISLACIAIVLLYSFSTAFNTRMGAALSDVDHFIHAQKSTQVVDINQQIEQGDRYAQTSWGNRLFNLKLSFQLMVNSPIQNQLFGYGTYGYAQVAKDYQSTLSSSNKLYGVTPITYEPDNNYISMWVENGLLGLLMFIGILFYWFKSLQYIRSDYRDLAKVGLLIFLISPAFMHPYGFMLIRLMLVPVFLFFMLYYTRENV